VKADPDARSLRSRTFAGADRLLSAATLNKDLESVVARIV
jgi:hypothetical protein